MSSSTIAAITALGVALKWRARATAVRMSRRADRALDRQPTLDHVLYGPDGGVIGHTSTSRDGTVTVYGADWRIVSIITPQGRER